MKQTRVHACRHRNVVSHPLAIKMTFYGQGVCINSNIKWSIPACLHCFIVDGTSERDIPD